MMISKTIEIDMGHRVPNHKSKCRNLHGHRYKIEVFVDGNVKTEKGSSDEGMVIDFGDLKDVMVEVIDKRYDHGIVLSTNDRFAEKIRDFGLKTILTEDIPTAENLAKLWFFELEPALDFRKIKLEGVKVWETPTSTAIFTLNDAIKAELL